MPVRLLAAGLAILLLAGCASMPNPFGGSAASSGAAAGAAGSATASHDPRMAALVAGGVVALTGPAVGTYMDQEEADLRAQLRSTGVSVTRSGDQIVLSMPAAITFDTDKSVVRQQFSGTLVSVGALLRKYDKTTIDVYGYTDSQGDDGYNKDLSQRRAVAVATLLANQGVDQRRFYIEGRGEADPITSNATESGRAQNRRVEIQLSPVT